MAAITVMTFSIMLLVVLGIAFMKGKGSSLIAGLNIASSEEQENIMSQFFANLWKNAVASSCSMLLRIPSTAHEID